MTIALSPPMTLSAKPISARPERERSAQILAKSLFRDLTAQGFAPSDIVTLATHLLDQVTSQVHNDADADRRA